VGRGRISEEQPTGVGEVVQGKDQDVEQIGAEDVAHGEIDGADPYCGQRHRELGQRRGRGQEDRADEGPLEPRRFGDGLRERRKQHCRTHDSGGEQDVARHHLAGAEAAQ